MKKIILIPAYEPDRKLIQLLQMLSQEACEIVVVNDGSNPSYTPLFSEAEHYAAVLTHPENLGKGEGIKTGLRYIQDHFREPFVVVTADADGQHSVPDIMRVAAAAVEKPDHLILGSRKIEKQTPLRSRLGNTITRLVFRLSTGSRVYDTQTGLRGFSHRLMPLLLHTPGSRYEYEMNVLMRFAKEQRPVDELWIKTIYLDGNSASHFDTVRDSWRIYREIMKFSGSSFLSFLVDYLLFRILYGFLHPLASGVVLANVFARLVSAGVNYTLNRRAVFRSREPVSESLPRYAMLAVGILLINTILLKGLVALGIAAGLAKLAVEAVMFVVSWSVQRRLIFHTTADAEVQAL